jgi:hypothetical protein
MRAIEAISDQICREQVYINVFYRKVTVYVSKFESDLNEKESGKVPVY